MDGKMSGTVADAVNYKGFPADRLKTGGWVPAALILEGRNQRIQCTPIYQKNAKNQPPVPTNREVMPPPPSQNNTTDNAYRPQPVDEKRIREEEIQMQKAMMDSYMAAEEARKKREEEMTRMVQSQQRQNDMDFVIRPHDHLSGPMLEMVLAQKRALCEQYGWPLP